jgi:hypothetical protein
VYFASGVPVFIHRDDDRVGQRIAAAQLVKRKSSPLYAGARDESEPAPRTAVPR